MSDETEKLIEEAWRFIQGTVRNGDFRTPQELVGDLLTVVLVRGTEAERDEAKRDAEAYKRQTQEVNARAIELTKEVSAKLEQAEAERDAQHAEVLRLTGELQQSRKESLERARTLLMLDEDFDEACALGFGLGCMLTNAQWRERDAAERAQRGLKLMQSCLQDEGRSSPNSPPPATY